MRTLLNRDEFKNEIKKVGVEFQKELDVIKLGEESKVNSEADNAERIKLLEETNLILRKIMHIIESV